jgi:hypothetical protein
MLVTENVGSWLNAPCHFLVACGDFGDSDMICLASGCCMMGPGLRASFLSEFAPVNGCFQCSAWGGQMQLGVKGYQISNRDVFPWRILSSIRARLDRRLRPERDPTLMSVIMTGAPTGAESAQPGQPPRFMLLCLILAQKVGGYFAAACRDGT